MMKTILPASASADAISLEAYYIGPKISPNKKYSTAIQKKTVLVKAVYPDGTKENVTDWKYTKGNYVQPGMRTKLEIQYQSLITEVEILFNYDIISFECHYHGDPVPIGTEFDPKKLHARALYGDGRWEELHSYQYSISDKLVTQKGNNNVYIATHPSGLEDRFVVFGYKVDDSDKDFKILLRNDNINIDATEIDVTDAYYPLFYHDLLGKIHVTAMKLNLILSPGEYRLILPKNTGLNCKHASEWKVVKDSNSNLKITPIKFYHEEDFENG